MKKEHVSCYVIMSTAGMTEYLAGYIHHQFKKTENLEMLVAWTDYKNKDEIISCLYKTYKDEPAFCLEFESQDDKSSFDKVFQGMSAFRYFGQHDRETYQKHMAERNRYMVDAKAQESDTKLQQLRAEIDRKIR